MLSLQQWLDRIHKSDNVRIVAYQFQLPFLSANLDDIDCTDSLGIGIKFVQIRDDLLLIRNGYIQSC